jgi:methylthioribose-1-phosphate isomerase
MGRMSEVDRTPPAAGAGVPAPGVHPKSDAAGAGGGPGPATTPEASGGPTAAPGADLDRRRFFRQFATDVLQTAATVVGAAAVIQRSSAEAASAILNPPREQESAAIAVAPDSALAPSAAGAGPASLAARAAGPSVAPAVGYRAAFRVDRDRIVLVDQRRLPFGLAEVECRTALDVANAIRERSIVGGPAIAQVAALGLAFSANRIRGSRPYARRAILRAAEATLTAASPTLWIARAAIERVMARYLEIGEFNEDGDGSADAMLEEANAIVFEANDDHGRIADAAAVRIPRRAGRPAGVLTIGSTGAMSGGQFGTALGAVQAATYTGIDVHVHVAESRPYLDGARIAAWELAQAGIPCTVLADVAIGSLLQSGRIDVVLVGAATIARNGDVANDVGTYPLAALAGRHGVPVIVCAPLAAMDPEIADGRGLATADGQPAEILQFLDARVAPRDTPVFNPLVDITPAGLVTAWATEEGLLEGTFASAFEAALARRLERLPRSPARATVVPDGSAMDDTAPPAAH